MRYKAFLAVLTVVLFAALPVWGQTNGGGQVPEVIKVVGNNSTPVTLNLSLFEQSSNWAGAFMWMHVADPTEVDILSVNGLLAPYTWTSPFGPQSNNTSEFTHWFTTFIPNASQSGTTLSGPRNVFSIVFLPKNTNAGSNSDIDFSFGLGPIFHVTSATVLSTSSFWWPGVPQTQNPSVIMPYHVTTSSFSAAASNFYGWLAGSYSVGIDHIPEPGSMVLLGSGLVCLMVGAAIRRRRRQA